MYIYIYTYLRNGACVNTQGSVSKSFCALEFPSTMVHKEMFRTALFCYLWVAGITICQQARIFSIWVFPHKWKSSSIAWSASEDHESASEDHESASENQVA